MPRAPQIGRPRRRGNAAWTRLSALVALLGAVGSPAPVHAGDPSLRWRTMTTPHFEVVFARRDLKAARRVATLAEAAHRALAPYMKHKPRGRVRIVVTDYTDFANGSAMVLPRNVINVFLAAPDSLSTLNDFDDWLFGLILHEYLHILHLDSIGGIAKLINWIFGKSYAPNHFQPDWFVEGFAIFAESAWTSAGRNRSSLFDMMLRMAVLERQAQSLPEISSASVRFPHGTVPYLYGSRFLRYLADRFGAEKLSRIGRDYGRQWLPYGLNKIARRHLGGKDYVRLYREWMAHLERRYRLQLRTVRRRGLTRARRLTHTGEGTYWPRYHPQQGWLVVADDDGKSHHALRRLDPRPPAARGKGQAREKPRKLLRLLPGGSSSFDPDGKSLVLSQVDVHKAVYDYADLYRLDLASGKVHRLTRGLRASEPDVSPDGRRIVCIVNQGGTTKLALLGADGLRAGAQPKILVRSGMFEQVSGPRWSPDGKRIVYSAWKRGGYRDLYLLDVASGRTVALTHDRAQDLSPTWSPDGRFIYFSSDRTGIYNVYAYEPRTRRFYQVTNVIAGALQPAVSPDGRQLAYIGFTAKGYDLYVTPLAPRKFRPAFPYVPDRPPAKLVAPAETRYEIRRYNPLRTLAPEAWTFSLQTTPGAESLTILLAGNDVANQHFWNLAASYGFSTTAFNVGANYAYTGLWPSIELGFTFGRGPRGGLTIAGEPQIFDETNAVVRLGTSLPVMRSRRFGSASVNIGYRLQRFGPLRPIRERFDPSAPLTRRPEEGALSGFTLSLSYSRVERYRFSVSAEKGRAFNVGVTFDHPAVGSDWRNVQLTWAYAEYLPMPWPGQHVLYLRLAGGLTYGTLRRRGVFSIGGMPGQDLVQSVIDQTPLAGNFLRGYPPYVLFGDQYHLLNVEYRFPITWINWAPSTLPIYFRRLYGAVFTDVGDAFFGKADLRRFKVGLGAELLLDVVIGYFQWMTFRLGYAHGFMEPGGHTYYLVFGVPFG